MYSVTYTSWCGFRYYNIKTTLSAPVKTGPASVKPEIYQGLNSNTLVIKVNSLPFSLGSYMFPLSGIFRLFFFIKLLYINTLASINFFPHSLIFPVHRERFEWRGERVLLRGALSQRLPRAYSQSKHLISPHCNLQLVLYDLLILS